MKKAISLVEVLVSIMLITTVIVAILQMKENNLFLLDKVKTISLNNDYISYALYDGTNRNEKIYLSDKVNFNDDDIRRKLKDIQISVKDTNLKNISVPENKYIKSVKVVESRYTLEKNKKFTTQKFYTFILEE